MKHAFETLTGVLVLGVAAFFIWISYTGGHIRTDKKGGYTIKAAFGEVGPLAVGSDVRVGGVKIGTVSALTLRKETYRPLVSMRIDPDVRLPSDSSAAIVSDGLLGGKYVALSPGSSQKPAKNGDELEFTQDAVSLEALLGKFAFGGVKQDGPPSKESGDPF
jgi:phospholipid/cholesterol/gamma-HCH transport system substrate-binding protein